jgi:hypothetical protein
MFTLALAGALAASLLPASPAPFKLDDFVARYVEALGGAARLRALKSVRESGTVKIVMGRYTLQGTYLAETKRPNKMRLEISAEEVHTLDIFDGSRGWSLDEEDGTLRPMSADELKDARLDAEFDDWLLDHARRGVTVEDLGPAQVGDAATRKLKVAFPGGAEHLYVDTTTYLEVRRDDLDAGGRPGDAVVTHGTTTVGGLRFAKEAEYAYAEMRARITLRTDKVELDPDIPDARFAPPK